MARSQWRDASRSMPSASHQRHWQEMVRIVASLLRKSHPLLAVEGTCAPRILKDEQQPEYTVWKSECAWQTMLLLLRKCRSPTAPFPKRLRFHTPDFPRLRSSATAQGPQLVVDSAWGPVFYNPGILIALTVTRDCLMHLWRTAKEKKSMLNYPSYRKNASLFVMPAEHNLRTTLWSKQPIISLKARYIWLLWNYRLA